jgi:hypothetical protein
MTPPPTALLEDLVKAAEGLPEPADPQFSNWPPESFDLTSRTMQAIGRCADCNELQAVGLLLDEARGRIPVGLWRGLARAWSDNPHAPFLGEKPGE